MGNLSALRAKTYCFHWWSYWSTDNPMIVLKQEYGEQVEPQQHYRCFRGSSEIIGWRTSPTQGAIWSCVPLLSTSSSSCLATPLSDFYRAWCCLVILFYEIHLRCCSWGRKENWDVINIEGWAEPMRMKKIKGTNKRKWLKMKPSGAFCEKQERLDKHQRRQGKMVLIKMSYCTYIERVVY